MLVQLNASATASRVGDLSARLGGFAIGKRFGLVDGFSARVTKAQAEALARMPSVANVELDGEVHALNDSAQASFGVTKARIDDPALDGDGDGNPSVYTPADLVAAVIDTGIDASHVDLDGGKVLAWKDYVNGRTTPYDDNGHGSHVSGTIAGDGDGRADHLYKGVAPAAGLIGLKVLDSSGSGSFSERHLRARLDRRQQGDLRDRGRQSLARRGRLQQRHRPDLAGDRARGRGGDRRRGRGRQRRPRHLHRRHARRGAGGADRRRDGRPRAGRLLPRVVLEPRPDLRRPHQARRRRARLPHHVRRGEHDQRLRDLQRHEHGDAVRGRRLAADARREPVADAAADQGRDDLDRRGLGPAGRRSRLRRRPARRLRRAARDRRAARLDRRGGADAHVPQRLALRHRREHRHHTQRHRHAVPDRGDDDRVERHGRDLLDAELQPRAAQPVRHAGRLGDDEQPPGRAHLQADDDGQLRPPRELGERQRPLLRRHLRRARAPRLRRLRRRLRRPAAAASSAASASSAAAPTAPGAPTLNSATAGPGSVTLAWSAPSSNGGSAITGYKVYRGTSSGGEAFVASVGATTSFTDTLVSAGATYYYTVTAVNSVPGESAPSNERSATLPNVPGSPTLSSATAGNGFVSLGWSAPANGGSAITGYTVYRSTSSGAETSSRPSAPARPTSTTPSATARPTTTR